MAFVALLNKVRDSFGKHFHYSRPTDLVFFVVPGSVEGQADAERPQE